MDIVPDTKFRTTRDGERIPLAAHPGRVEIHLPSSSRAGIGCITSRESGVGFWELKAFELGCTVEEAKRRAQS
jgi:hypothetical protein